MNAARPEPLVSYRFDVRGSGNSLFGHRSCLSVCFHPWAQQLRNAHGSSHTDDTPAAL
jgi:hypothetical protein